MQRLELATLSIRTARPPLRCRGSSVCGAAQGPGAFAGVWTAEIGTLNRILVLRSFDAQDELFAERARIVESGDFFGASDQLVDARSRRGRRIRS